MYARRGYVLDGVGAQWNAATRVKVVLGRLKTRRESLSGLRASAGRACNKRGYLVVQTTCPEFVNSAWSKAGAMILSTMPLHRSSRNKRQAGWVGAPSTCKEQQVQNL